MPTRDAPTSARWRIRRGAAPTCSWQRQLEHLRKQHVRGERYRDCGDGVAHGMTMIERAGGTPEQHGGGNHETSTLGEKQVQHDTGGDKCQRYDTGCFGLSEAGPSMA